MITPVGRHRRGTPPRPTSPAWVLVDQAVNSVSNVGATILVAGAVPGRVFAVFATGQLILALGQTVMLAAASDRLLQSAPECRAVRHAAGLAFYRRGLLVGAALAIPAALVGTAAAYLAAAAVATVACGLDYVRTSLITAGRVRAAIAADSAFAVLQLGGLAVWSLAGGPGAATGAWAVWGAAALVVFLPFGLGLARTFPAAAPERLREAVSVRYGLEMAAVNGSGQVAQLAASTTIGLALNGMLRGAQIPFGVVVLALMAARVVLIPAFARPDARRLAVAAVGGVVGLCVVTGLVTWAASAAPATRFLVAGQRLDVVFVALTTASYAGIGIQLIVFYLLRARHDDRAVGVSRFVVVAGFALTALWSGATRSAEAFLVGSTLTWLAAVAVMLWWHSRGIVVGAADSSPLDDAAGVAGPAALPSAAVAA